MAAQITALPTPPTRQDPTNFNDRADAFLAALPGFQSEANALSTEVNTRADNVQASDLAVLAATNITKWVSGTTYAQGAVVWSPINGLGYRRITASGSGTTDPSSDSTNYRQVNGTGNVSTDTNNNIGLGTTPSAWGSGYKTVDINTYGAITSNTGNSLFLAGNAFFNGTNWVYKTNHGNGAHLFGLNPTGFSGFSWSIAPSGTAGNPISFTQAMTLDASGNLLLGTTTVAAKLTLGGVSAAENWAAFKDSSGNNYGFIGIPSAGGAFAIQSVGSVPLAFNTNGTERARIDSSGNLLINQTVSGGTTGVNANAVAIEKGTVITSHNSVTTSGAGYAYFGYNATTIGSITQSGTTGVSYNTSSDYRLKHDISPMQNALQRVAALKPCTYKWNADGSNGEGFIAHELAEVCPSAVTGEKDAVDADGKPVYQGIDTSFLVATLVAAIQEQQITIANLTSRIEALESALPK